MNDEAKRFVLDSMRKVYSEFIQEMIKVPGSGVHKQQALFRFEEAYMWMQNAIVSFEVPAAPPAEPAQPQEQECQPAQEELKSEDQPQ